MQANCLPAQRAVALFCLAALSGCSLTMSGEGPVPGASQEPGTHREYRLQHDGRDRTYSFYLPKGYDASKPAAVLIALHGGGGSAERWPAYTNNGFENLADRDGFLLVYPNGIENQWNDKRGIERFRAQKEDVDDVGFLSALIDRLREAYSVDARRVYLTGASNGAMMANYAGAELSDKVAAIASVIGSIPENLAGKLRPKEPISVLMINGTEDPLVRWEGGLIKLGRTEHGRVIPVEKTVEFWVTVIGARAAPKVEALPDADPDDGTLVVRQIYSGGRRGTEVILCKIIGGGHHWPAREDTRRRLARRVVDRTIGLKSRDIDACAVIWEFCKSHPKADAGQAEHDQPGVTVHCSNVPPAEPVASGSPPEGGVDTVAGMDAVLFSNRRGIASILVSHFEK